MAEKIIIVDDRGEEHQFTKISDLVAYANSFQMSWLPDGHTWDIQSSETLNPEIVEDAITWYESKGISCRNESDDFVDLLVRDKSGVAMAWVQVSEKELEYRADMLEEEHR